MIANSDKPDTVNDAGDSLNPEIAALIANSDKPDTVNDEYEDQLENPIDLESDSISEHIKKELSEFRKEIKEIKNKLDITQKSTELLDSYKDPIFELKAFKTEIQNPLKFIENMTQDYNLKNSPFLKSKDDEKPEKHHELMENIFKESVSPIISEAPFSKYNEESTNTNENSDSISPPNKSLTNLDNLDEKDDTWQQ